MKNRDLLLAAGGDAPQFFGAQWLIARIRFSIFRAWNGCRTPMKKELEYWENKPFQAENLLSQKDSELPISTFLVEILHF